ncbi:HIT family protein [Streptomyces sp. NPDC055607]
MSTYLEDLSAAFRERRAWTCPPCGTSNPSHYNACHNCQHPSWTCEACGTVSAQACSTCTECDEQREDSGGGYEMTRAEYVNLKIGPRVVGGRYRPGANGEEYEVLHIDREPDDIWVSWRMTVLWLNDGRETTHCTGWDSRRDTVVSMPESCVFCAIVAGQAPAVVVREWPDAIAIRPRSGGVHPGHLLVIPRQHITDAGVDQEIAASAERRASELLAELPAGNIVTSKGREATQTVFHAHWHVLPRTENDDLPLPWTPQHTARAAAQNGEIR